MHIPCRLDHQRSFVEQWTRHCYFPEPDRNEMEWGLTLDIPGHSKFWGESSHCLRWVKANKHAYLNLNAWYMWYHTNQCHIHHAVVYDSIRSVDPFLLNHPLFPNPRPSGQGETKLVKLTTTFHRHLFFASACLQGTRISTNLFSFCVFFIDFILMGEVLGGNGHIQKMCQRGPSIRPVVHQQALRRNDFLYSLVVAMIVSQANVLLDLRKGTTANNANKRKHV